MLGLLDLAPVVVLVFTGVALQYLYVYRDAGLRSLTVLILDGPYAGSFTTHEKRDYIEAGPCMGHLRIRLPDRLLRRLSGRVPLRPRTP